MCLKCYCLWRKAEHFRRHTQGQWSLWEGNGNKGERRVPLDCIMFGTPDSTPCVCNYNSKKNNSLKSFASLVTGRYLAAIDGNEVINSNAIIGKDSLRGKCYATYFQKWLFLHCGVICEWQQSRIKGFEEMSLRQTELYNSWSCES